MGRSILGACPDGCGDKRGPGCTKDRFCPLDGVPSRLGMGAGSHGGGERVCHVGRNGSGATRANDVVPAHSRSQQQKWLIARIPTSPRLFCQTASGASGQRGHTGSPPPRSGGHPACRYTGARWIRRDTGVMPVWLPWAALPMGATPAPLPTHTSTTPSRRLSGPLGVPPKARITT